MKTRAGDVGAAVLSKVCSELGLESRKAVALECYQIEKALLFEHDREIALARILRCVTATVAREEGESSENTGGDA